MQRALLSTTSISRGAAVKEAGGRVFKLEAPRGEPTLQQPAKVGFVRLRESAEAAARRDPKASKSKFDGDAGSRCGHADVLRLAVGYGVPRHDDPTKTRWTPPVRCTAAGSHRSHRRRPRVRVPGDASRAEGLQENPRHRRLAVARASRAHTRVGGRSQSPRCCLTDLCSCLGAWKDAKWRPQKMVDGAWRAHASAEFGCTSRYCKKVHELKEKLRRENPQIDVFCNKWYSLVRIERARLFALTALVRLEQDHPHGRGRLGMGGRGVA